MNVIYSADPYVFLDEKSGYYYSFATSDKDNMSFVIHKSSDLVNWSYVSHALDTKHEKIWAKDWFWAPECYYNPNNGYYYLFYSARVKDELAEKYFSDPNYEEACKIGVAVSKNIEGPYVNISDEPLDFSPYDFEYVDVDTSNPRLFIDNDPKLLDNAAIGAYIPAIDVNILFENDRMFMYFSRCCYKNCRFDKEFNRYIEASNVAGLEIETDWWYDKDAKSMPKIKKEFITYDVLGKRRDRFISLISYQLESQSWENAHVDDYRIYDGARKNRRWSEGSTAFRVNFNGKSQYALTYSCNCFEDRDYAVGIAFSDNPLGPFKKHSTNPIIQEVENGVCSTGHGSLIEKNGELIYFLHARRDPKEDRILAYTKLSFAENISHDQIVVCNLIKEVE